MVAIKIVKPFLTSGSPFPIQVMRATRGDVTLTLKVGNRSRDFGVDGSPPGASITLRVSGGAPRNFQVTDWGSASKGSVVTMTATTPEGAKDFDSATVGL
jgi:hypothetical protein